LKKSFNDWSLVITPSKQWFQIDLKEIWEYRELIGLFVKRNITTYYKQTILGPLWFILQPLITSIVFNIIFAKVANIPTDNIPPLLFYMSGIVAWNYFSSCLMEISNTFNSNAVLFGKVYFPRIIIPLSIVITNLIKFIIQLTLFFSFYLFYLTTGNNSFQFNFQHLLLLPVLILLMAMLGLGMGMLVSSVTVRYKDLRNLINFGTQLLMYASPIVYPLSIVPDRFRIYIILNPMTSVIEGFRSAFLNVGSFTIEPLIYSIIISFFIMLLGLIIFNRTEKNFIDSI